MRRFRFLSILLIPALFSAMFFCGCNLAEKPVTKQEAAEFALKLDKAMAEKKGAMLNNVFHEKEFKERIRTASGGKLSNNELRTLPEIIRKRKLGTEILKYVGENGFFQLVKQYEKMGRQHLIFRLFGDGGLNYYDMELAHAGKEVKVADMYVYTIGENFSKTLADLFIQIGGYFDKAGSKDFVKTATDMRKLISESKFDEAMTLFNTLPDTLKKQKGFQMTHVQIASGLDNELYKLALTEYAALYPNEPDMNLLLLDHHFLNEEYDKALQDVNRMDSLINKDPFLDYYRGLIYKSIPDNTKAIEYFEQLYKNMPGYGSGIIELIAAYDDAGNKSKLADMLRVYRKNKNLNQQTLENFYLVHPDWKNL